MSEPEIPVGTHPAAWPVNGPAWIDPHYGEVSRAARRPKRVKLACLLTWGTAVLVPYSYLMWLAGFLLMPDTFIPMLMRWLGMGYVNFTSSDQQWVYVLVHLLIFGWAVLAMVLAWFAWKRKQWARRGLMISAALTLPLCLMTFPLSFFQLLACPAVIMLLWLSRDWFAPLPARRTENAERITIPPRRH